MKKIKITLLFLLLIFLSFIQIGMGQTTPRVHQHIRYFDYGQPEDFWKFSETTYSYNEAGDITETLTKRYNEPNVLFSTHGTFYEYGANQLLKKKTLRRYNPDVDLWITIRWTDYEYYTDGSLAEEKETKNVGGIVNYKANYVRNGIGQIKSIYIEHNLGGFIYDSFQERDYHADQISYDEDYYNWSFNGDSLFLNYESKRIIDENENLLEIHITQITEYKDTASVRKTIYSYDEQENMTSYMSYSRTPYTNDSWGKKSEELNHNEYDQDGFLIEKKIQQFYFDAGLPVEILSGNKTYTYQNSCIGLNEAYEIDPLELNAINERHEYIYEGINECFDLEEKDLKILIYPNPSHGFIEISSPVFQTGNTAISVYSIDGKALLQKMENNRSTTSLDLSSLPNGLYILQLRNGDHFVKEKIVIAK